MKRTLGMIITISAITLFGGLAAQSVQAAEGVSMPFSNGAFAIDSETGSRGLFDQVSALCKDLNGKATYVIPVRSGRHTRLTEVGYEAALAYAGGVSGDSSWIMACDGSRRFIVEKSYASLTKGVQTAIFNSNRGLEGVDYVRSTESVPVSLVASAEPADRGAFIEQIAWEVSTLKMDFVRPQGETRFTGIYNGANGSTCEMVSVKEESRGTVGTAAIHDFRVCGKEIASLGTRGVASGRMLAKASF